jgi:hypothetical protein
MRSPRPVFACMRFLLSHFVVAVMLIIAGRDMGIKTLDEMLVDDDDDCVALAITVLICFVFLIRYSIHILTKRKTNDWGLATTEQVVG